MAKARKLVKNLPKKPPKKTTLLKQFEGMWVHHIKVWTPARSRIEFTGPLPSVLGEFLIMALSGRLTAEDATDLLRITHRIRGRKNEDTADDPFPFHTERRKERIWVTFRPNIDHNTFFAEELDHIIRANPSVVLDLRKVEVISPAWTQIVADMETRSNVAVRWHTTHKTN